MDPEAISAAAVVAAPADVVFAVLADPASHASIDGTGWVCEPVDRDRLTRSGQVFRMGMFHPDHPDGRYETANQVREREPSRAISWATGTEDAQGELHFGGWTWRYDLAATADGGTHVRLTYDWSGATPQAREVLEFPPFGVDHLEDSLRHLAVLATAEECCRARNAV